MCAQPSYTTFLEEIEQCGQNELAVYVETEDKQLKRINIILDASYTIRRVKAMFQHISHLPIKDVPVEEHRIDAEKQKTPSVADLFGVSPTKEPAKEPAPPKNEADRRQKEKSEKPSVADLFGETPVKESAKESSSPENAEKPSVFRKLFSQSPKKEPAKQQVTSKKTKESDHKAKPGVKQPSNGNQDKRRGDEKDGGKKHSSTVNNKENKRPKEDSSKKRNCMAAPEEKPGSKKPSNEKPSITEPPKKSTTGALLPEKLPKAGSAKRRLPSEPEEAPAKADCQQPKRPSLTGNKSNKRKISVPEAFSFTFDQIRPNTRHA